MDRKQQIRWMWKLIKEYPELDLTITSSFEGRVFEFTEGQASISRPPHRLRMPPNSVVRIVNPGTYRADVEAFKKKRALERKKKRK